MSNFTLRARLLFMGKNKRTAIIISASSDIGAAMCRRWIARGWRIFGTYRTKSQTVDDLENIGVRLFYCDLADAKSIHNACLRLRRANRVWDALVLCPGTQDPVGRFEESDFNEWEQSIRVNFTGQMRLLHELLPTRNPASRLGSCVLFFAGGGTNSAVINYSAYTVSKIALIKMCELLDAEIWDTRFVIVGPGWVKTKIHQSTLRAGSRAGENYAITLKKLSGKEYTPRKEVMACCDWIVNSSRRIIGGRNFSVAFDSWGTKELERKLLQENNMYKLRRHGNEWSTSRNAMTRTGGKR